MQFRPEAWPFLLLLSCVLWGCGSDYLYERSYPIDSSNWTYADSLQFSFEIEDTLQVYNLWLEVEHSVDYDFQNLYTRIHTRFPSGQQLAEPLSLELADNVGRWFGDCNSKTCTLKIPIQEGAFFNQAGTYNITLEQFMRRDPIEGIRTIGFMVEKTDQTRQQ
ncbi:gliding motility lipoprotein GldH [Flavilitoribacter nigricans]|uniref:Gliding motility lipoprotein GldH n=1 Tax=Flavilitoribacter nigricans (strain ATCC 23147 / DSM 23189 / NBRC 102662 / NCIMB 1420 / SS-2) TaxID=1122177 RepID=A0A2D0N682_FLAN2|nr:gliding motility lipoprotein GldH [Flavilitoribacter nigricans]PHN04021.1 hypothetical protein CRP01_24455 [Flavilitoribacter nigricans DSM 23189 = NBRC 102662]